MDFTSLLSGGYDFPQQQTDGHTNVSNQQEMDNVGNLDSEMPITQEDLKELVDWLKSAPLDEVDSHVPATLATDDPESPYRGQWSKMEELSSSGSPRIKADINQLWAEMSEGFFNITFRRGFAHFIERKCWHNINPADDEPGSLSMQIATTIINQLRTEIDNTLLQMSQAGNQDFGMVPQDFKFQLQRWSEKLNDTYNCHPMEVVQYIQRILSQENVIIASAEQEKSDMSSSVGLITGKIAEITNDITQLERIAQRSISTIDSLFRTIQDLQICTNDKAHAINQICQRVEISNLNTAEMQKWKEIRTTRDRVITEEENILQQCHAQPMNKLIEVMNRVVGEELPQWQRNQAYSNNGKNISAFCTITNLENWFKRLAKLINVNMHQMTKMIRIEEQLGHQRLPISPQPPQNLIECLLQKYTVMLHELVQKGLVVEKHPPQVLMKDKRFACQLRHLVGDGLDIHQVPFDVDAWLLNAEQAAHVIKEGPISSFAPTGKIVNSTAKSDYIDHMHQLSVNMRTMCLKMQQRGATRNAEMVAELKFAMLFRARIPIRFPPNSASTVAAQTLSLPIVVISHGKQEADAQATIFWDNAFAKVPRTPFEVDDSVLWSWMLNALDARWKKECEEGGRQIGLSDASKEYLTMKLFNDRRVPNNTVISWKRFNHDKLFSCGGSGAKNELFTFWNWFFKAMELVSSPYVKKYWNAGLIHGFLSKADCQRMLLESGTPGVFLFRFSETKLGAISISCSTVANETCLPQVRHLQPDVIKNFQVRSLPDMVHDLHYLRFLYPNKLKDSVFGVYYTPKEQPPSGDDDYMPKNFVVHTPDPRAMMDPSLSLQAPSPNVRLGDSESEDMSEDMN